MYKKGGFLQNFPSRKNQNFYTIKNASTKSTVWLENDFACFLQQLRKSVFKWTNRSILD